MTIALIVIIVIVIAFDIAINQGLKRTGRSDQVRGFSLAANLA